MKRICQKCYETECKWRGCVLEVYGTRPMLSNCEYCDGESRYLVPWELTFAPINEVR